MRYRWTLAPSQPLITGQLIRELSLSPLLAQCLANRGVSAAEEAEEFLNPRLQQMADPFLVPNMDLALDRLWVAREKGELVVVFGDYDVDGVSSTALLLEVFRELGWRVEAFLPGRFAEGYGLSTEAIQNCLDQFPLDLLLAVDCGSTAAESVANLQDRGIDVLVLDHHQISEPAPPAVAMVNPQLSEDPNFQELCTAGLAFKLAHALIKRGREEGREKESQFDLRPFLDFVALGTLADLVPLVRENRRFVRAGLDWLTRTRRPGLVALKKVAKVEGPVTGFNVGFHLGPRLNAAGRLQNAKEALDLLLCKDSSEAEKLALILDSRNSERQEIERGIADQIISAVRARFNPESDYVIVEGEMLWHIGVVGIVASRVMREFNRPAIILGGEKDGWKGSGRSIEGFDLAAALCQCDDLLLDHGGHAMAAGMTVKPDDLDAFRQRINEVARKTIQRDLFQPPLRLDAETDLSEMTLVRLEEMKNLEPMGQGNPEVQLLVPGLTLSSPVYRIGRDKQHRKFWVTDGRCTCETLAWNLPQGEEPEGTFDLAFAPKINEFNGRRTVQLKMLDWRTAVG